MDYLRSVLDYGYVKLLNISGPTRRADAPFDAASQDPANSARLSFDQRDTRSLAEDLKLTTYLHKNKHTTPFEMIETWWEIKLPIFVARQLVRHRTVSINEVSRRYVDGPVEYYTPKTWRAKAISNKQGSSGLTSYQCLSSNDYRRAMDYSTSVYKSLLADKVCPEQARLVLPVSVYTKWLWKQDLHNLLHMLNLRSDTHAQWETQQYANAMLELLREVLPELMEIVA